MRLDQLAGFSFGRASALAVVAALVLMLAAQAGAADASVSGRLSSPTASVGEPVEYELTVEGASLSTEVPLPEVDGLEVRGRSQGSELRIINGDVTRRTTITYTLVPQREGKFTIPALEVEVDGKTLKTQPVTLTVSPGQPAVAAGDFAFAEIRLPKQAAYVGEALLIEVRLHLDSSARWNLQQAPTLEGEGFTTQPFGKPDQRQVELAGTNYTQVVFRTAVTPGRAGKLKIGPLPAKLVYSKPQQRRNRYDLFGFERMGPAQEIEVTAPAVELDVKPLPVDGRPADFAGAIGSFEFEAAGSPARVNAGEPVEMTLVISGRGNFDRITAPPLADADGWRAYDAEEHFEKADEPGISGRKTFKLPVAPMTAKTAMPVFVFSFFDPEKAAYKTLRNVPQALTVLGATAPAVPAADPPVPESQPVPAAADDILGRLPQMGAVARPVWGISLAAMAGILFAPVPVLAVLLLWRARRGDLRGRRLSELRRERAALLERVRNAADRAEVHDAAVRLLLADVEMMTGRPLPVPEAGVVIASRKLDAATARSVEELFAARAELLYAGGADDGRISQAERDRVIETVSAFEKCAPR